MRTLTTLSHLMFISCFGLSSLLYAESSVEYDSKSNVFEYVDAPEKKTLSTPLPNPVDTPLVDAPEKKTFDTPLPKPVDKPLSETLGTDTSRHDTDARVLYAIHLGVMDHEVKNLWSHNHKEGGTDYGLEATFNSEWLEFWSGVVRPNIGLTWNNQGDTSKAYAGIVWETMGKHWFFDFAWGMAAHDGVVRTKNKKKSEEHKELGTRFLFRTAFELGYDFTSHHGLSFIFDHISNAGFSSKNPGLDIAGFRYRYRY